MMMERNDETIKKSSLTKEQVFIVAVLAAGTVLLCYFFNAVLIERYYLKNKQNTLLEGFYVIDEASRNNLLHSHIFDVTFANLCANGNITVLIISSDQTVVRSSANDTQMLWIEFMNVLFGASRGDSVVLEQEDNYNILRHKDVRLDSEFLVLYGTLSNGNLILMRSALESIRESAAISNRFLAFAGSFAVLISTIIISFVSKSIINAEELKNANRALQRDIEEKIQVDEMRQEFLSNVSHELKTPLAVIAGYAEGLKECVNDDPESRDYYCEVILDETEKMTKMVKQLLCLNQLEFGQEKLVMQRFDLTELVQGVLQKVSILLENNEIAMDFLEKNPMYVWGDEFKIEEVLTNYISNAIHYAKGEKQIRIYYTKREQCVRVHVFNTGETIPEKAIPEIWTKFYKVDKARTREYGGTGIGLSIVKAIMESHKQRFGVQNHENGVEFWFELEQNSSV